jgi:flagellar biosynthetic protein FliR
VDWDLNNWMMVFVRAGAFLTILPIFTMLNVPVQMRIALAALLAVLVAPTLPPFPLANLGLFDWVGLITREVLCGLLIGFVTRMVFFASDFAGQLIANEMGLNLASVLDPANGRPTQAPGMVMFLLTCVMMMSLDMHHWLLTGFQQSYTVVPIGGAGLHEALFTNILDHTSRVFVVGLQIASPLIAASFLALLLLGFLGRLVPQMNIFAESFAVRITCGLLVFALTLQITAQHILNGLHRLPQDMMRVAQFLGVG